MELALSVDGSTSPGSSLDESEEDLEVFPLDIDEDTSDDVDQVHESLDRAWGTKKSHFYGADEGSSSGDELEEMEAKELQQRMYSGLDEADFASHWFEELEPSSNTLKSSAATLAEERKQDFKLFISFQEHVKWLLRFGIPAVKLYSRLPLLTAEGYGYLHCKVHILFNYCINILYCLQRERKAVDHPNISRMAVLHKLMLQVSEIDRQLEAVIEKTLRPAGLDSKSASTIIEATTVRGSQRSVQKKSRSNGSPASLPGEPQDEALEFYEKVKRAKRRKRSLGTPSVQSVEGAEEEGKRAITFQMARNKGLTPSRKKEQRNPRVKHRNKYRKALVKRKSQVLPVVSELTQYGGERSGIRSKLARSVALK